MRGLFVTGTDTNVGKTLVAAGLLRRARRAGLDAVPMKPVQTGASREGGRLLAPDLEYCLRAAGLVVPDQERARMCPFLYEPACSPHLAGRMAAREVELAPIFDAAAQLAAAHDAVIVEGAGGVLVPLNERQTMLDLMRVLALPVVLVARGTLGTINHTLLALVALRATGLRVLGVVLNDGEATARDFVREDNPLAIARFGAVPILAEIPYLGDLAAPEAWERVDRELAAFDLPRELR